jgi:hypothetical protein
METIQAQGDDWIRQRLEVPVSDEDDILSDPPADPLDVSVEGREL